MTREEREKLLRHLKYNRSIGDDYLITDKDADEIIKALEQEPCEDCVSRQAVLDATVKRNSIWNKITNSKGENLEEIISQLPPVTPHPKTGHWIDRSWDDVTDENVECSACGKWRWGKTNYCPNCGCRMEGEIE